MNSLNILSGLSTSPASTARALSQDPSSAAADRSVSDLTVGSAYDAETLPLLTQESGDMARVEAHPTSVMHHQNNETHMYDEKSRLLAQQPGDEAKPVTGYAAWMLTRQIPGSIAGAVRMVIAAILAPGRYLIACFYDDEGQFSPMMPFYRMARSWSGGGGGARPTPEPPAIVAMDFAEKPPLERTVSSAKLARTKKSSRRQASTASSSALTSDSELDSERPSSRDEDRDSPALHTRSRTASAAPDEIAPSKRSIRIKLHNDEALQERKRKSQARKKSPVTAANPETLSTEEAAAALKSPTSPATSSKMTKFPRAPLPPRPLVPRRQPSYTTSAAAVGPHQKTLIIDLDETLIHSQVKGGRFTTGHMVEVKLQQPIGVGGVTLGPQVPILYYVNKRPHCDEFLRKVRTVVRFEDCMDTH
jgi:CTD nuclear envelope phosphatase 1